MSYAPQNPAIVSARSAARIAALRDGGVVSAAKTAARRGELAELEVISAAAPENVDALKLSIKANPRRAEKARAVARSAAAAQRARRAIAMSRRGGPPYVHVWAPPPPAAASATPAPPATTTIQLAVVSQAPGGIVVSASLSGAGAPVHVSFAPPPGVPPPVVVDAVNAALAAASVSGTPATIEEIVDDALTAASSAPGSGGSSIGDPFEFLDEMFDPDAPKLTADELLDLMLEDFPAAGSSALSRVDPAEEALLAAEELVAAAVGPAEARLLSEHNDALAEFLSPFGMVPGDLPPPTSEPAATAPATEPAAAPSRVDPVPALGLAGDIPKADVSLGAAFKARGKAQKPPLLQILPGGALAGDLKIADDKRSYSFMEQEPKPMTDGLALLVSGLDEVALEAGFHSGAITRGDYDSYMEIVEHVVASKIAGPGGKPQTSAFGKKARALFEGPPAAAAGPGAARRAGQLGAGGRIPVGHFFIDEQALRGGNLQLRYANGGKRVSGIPDQTVSPGFAKIFLQRHVRPGPRSGIALTASELDAWQTMLRLAGPRGYTLDPIRARLLAAEQKRLSAPRPRAAEQADRLRVLLGSRAARNDSPELLAEARLLAEGLVAAGAMTRSDAVALGLAD